MGMKFGQRTDRREKSKFGEDVCVHGGRCEGGECRERMEDLKGVSRERTRRGQQGGDLGVKGGRGAEGGRGGATCCRPPSMMASCFSARASTSLASKTAVSSRPVRWRAGRFSAIHSSLPPSHGPFESHRGPVTVGEGKGRTRDGNSRQRGSRSNDETMGRPANMSGWLQTCRGKVQTAISSPRGYFQRASSTLNPPPPQQSTSYRFLSPDPCASLFSPSLPLLLHSPTKRPPSGAASGHSSCP